MEQEQSSSSSRPTIPRLRKMMSWSAETDGEEVWRRRKEGSRIRGRSRIVTDDDLDELKACMELGFGFHPNSTDLEPRLSDTLPALGFYCAVHKHYNHLLLRTPSESSISTSSSDGDGGGYSPLYVDTGEDPETVKARLKQWARVVACSVKQIAEGPQI